MSKSPLTRTKWRFRSRVASVPALLHSLGIEFRPGPFWEANKLILRELHAELITEARTKFRELHPDTGGDAVQFDAFVQSLKRAKHLFARHLPVEVNPPKEDTVTEVKGRAVGSKGFGFYRPARAFAAIGLLLQGYNKSEVARELRMHVRTVRKIHRLVLKGRALFCLCKRPLGHRGTCGHILVRYPKRQAFLKSGHLQEMGRRNGAARKGVPQSAEHLAKRSAAISIALKAYHARRREELSLQSY